MEDKPQKAGMERDRSESVARPLQDEYPAHKELVHGNYANNRALIEEFDQLLTAYKQLSDTALQSQGWQTMDSAPKDGSQILVYGRYGVVLARCGQDGRAYTGEQDFDAEATHWQPLPPPPSLEKSE